MQPTRMAESRTYADYETVVECMEGLCKVFEEHLKRLNPTSSQITYDITQLYEFIESFSDMSVLVFQKSTNTYTPYGKAWIKEKIYNMLRMQAGQ
jgi:hypothetical protein